MADNLNWIPNEYVGTTGGYSCPDCGQWVVFDEGHTCDRETYYNWPPYSMTPIITIDEETKAILERIATALEDIAAARGG